jgi:DNA polymerase-3 subunit beta
LIGVDVNKKIPGKNKMNISVSQRGFARALARVRATCPAKSSIPILETVRLQAESGTVTLVTNDLEHQTEVMLPADLDGDAVTFCVDFNQLQKIVAANTDDVLRLEYANGKLVIFSAGSRFQLLTLDANEFPMMEAIAEAEHALECESAIFDAGVVAAAGRFASDDELRPTLMAINFEARPDGALRLVSTDGHCLGLLDQRHDAAQGKAFQVLVPPVAANMLAGCQNVYYGNNVLRLEDGTAAMTVKTIYGKYPNYDNVIPAEFAYRFTVQRDALARVIELGLISAPVNSKQVRLVFTAGSRRITVLANDAERGSEYVGTIEADESAETDMKIGFNGGYLLSALRSCLSDVVTMCVNDAKSGVLLQPQTVYDRDLRLVMPIRLKEE